MGAWVAIVLLNGNQIILQGIEVNTKHQRMELLAVINAIEYVYNNIRSEIVMQVFTDSQYVVGLPARQLRLSGAGYTTKSGRELNNKDLVASFYSLWNVQSFELNKVRAHQSFKGAINYNEVADQLVRKTVRASVK